LTRSFKASASGRVNLMGEHTDYNCGFVLPTAIPQMTRVEVWPRRDSWVRAESIYMPPGHSLVEYKLGEEVSQRGWIDYLQGITRILVEEGFLIQGFDVKIDSNVPMGSGLSSSAALEVSLLRGLRDAFTLSLDDIQISQLSQRVENEFVGAQVGIMDPLAASLTLSGQALFLDTMDLSFRQIPLPLEDMDLLVIHSGVTHRHVGGGYNERRSECEKASELLEVSTLRDLNRDQLFDRQSRLPEPLFRRARHVLTENERVLASVRAIEKKDVKSLGKLFYESHQSMRDDYEVSIPEIDRLVEIAKSEKGVLGARLTGGGFGGSVVILTSVGKSKAIGKKVSLTYQKEVGKIPQILMPNS
jgi:galactokinase